MKTIKFSRKAGVGVMGLNGATIKACVPEQLAVDLRREAHALGIDVSTFVRDLLMVRLYGADHVERLHAARLRAVAGNGPETGIPGRPGLEQ